MTINEWMTEVKANQGLLREFISNYHPGMDTYRRKSMNITAPNAERACQVVRSEIKRSTISNPLVDFDNAVKENNWGKINSLLNSAWFGVPESTSCWQIKGFSEAVALMEDIPDMEDE